MAETVIAVSVPEAEAAIQNWRIAHTESGAQDMPPHITLLYPFTDTSLLAVGRIREARGVLSQFGPVDFELTQTAYFQDGDAHILYLQPEPSDPFKAMAEALVEQFPEHKPYGGAFDQIIPHVTVARSQTTGVLESIQEQLQSFLPIAARATEAGLWELTEDRWRRRSKLMLGVTEVDYTDFPLFH